MSQEQQPQTGYPSQPPSQPPFPPRKAASDGSGGFFKGCVIAAIVVVALGVVGTIGLIILVLSASSAGGPVAQSGLVNLQEVTVGGTRGGPKVACIPVQGVIYGASMPGAELTPVALVSAQLDRAQNDPRVRGVILYVDSPGGDITASDILHKRIRDFRESKPVVVCMMDVAASGAYYVSAPANHIIAHPTTVTGSIGVLMPLFDATGLLKKVGVRSESITAGAFKNIGSPFEEKTEEQKLKERQILQEIVDAMHAQFVRIVSEDRKMDVEKVRELADGRIFTSDQAMKLGLIDEIGYEADAVAAIRRVGKIGEPELVQYRRVVSFTDIIAAFASGPAVNLEVKGGLLPGVQGPRPMFLWAPPLSESEHGGTAQ